MPADPVVTATLRRLQELAGDPDEQAQLAIRVLQTHRQAQLLEAALEVLSHVATPEARPLLLLRYDSLDKDGIRRDPLGCNRTAIIRALRLAPRREDIRLLERAATTYEFSLYDHAEIACLLRAAALVALDDLDSTLASYHATRLLVDPYTDRMSGEPAVTAVGVLAAEGNTLPLYALVADATEHPPEVVGECLRRLTRLPASLLPAVVEKHRAASADVVLAGLFDLILGHQARGDYLDLLAEFMQTTTDHNLYRYLASAIVAQWRDDLAGLVQHAAATERNAAKREALREALSVRAGTPAIDPVLRTLTPRR